MDHAAPFSFAKMLTDLTGRRVNVANAAAGGTKTKQVVGLYRVEPAGYTVALKIDLPLLGSLGGTMVGLPDGVVKQNLAATPLDEMLRDAMHEVLNVLSSLASSEGRAILKKVDFDAAAAESVYNEQARRPHCANSYDVTVAGYVGGSFSLLTPIQTDPAPE